MEREIDDRVSLLHIANLQTLPKWLPVIEDYQRDYVVKVYSLFGTVYYDKSALFYMFSL